MNTFDKQKELDKIKWDKSVRLGFDACGSFDYCKCCDKAIENPCAIAHNKFYNNEQADHEMLVNIVNDDIQEVKEKKAKKTTTKSTAKAKSTETKAKTTKSTSKKTTTKKTTKK